MTPESLRSKNINIKNLSIPEVGEFRTVAFDADRDVYPKKWKELEKTLEQDWSEGKLFHLSQLLFPLLISGHQFAPEFLSDKRDEYLSKITNNLKMIESNKWNKLPKFVYFYGCLLYLDAKKASSLAFDPHAFFKKHTEGYGIINNYEKS